LDQARPPVRRLIEQKNAGKFKGVRKRENDGKIGRLTWLRGVRAWADLPRDTQELLFEAAMSHEPAVRE
jgi:hypothetical protein